jgi:uncharacterized protein
MKARHWIVAFLLLGLVAIGLLFWLVRQLTPPPASTAALDPVAAEITARFLDHLEAARYADAAAMLAPAAAGKLGVDTLEEVWTTLPQQVGALQGRGAARGENVGGRDVTTVPLLFEKMPLDARVALDGEHRIAGFRLVPAQAPASGAAPAPAGITETERGVGDHALPGTLALPAGAGPHPAVVLVHGSGPNDRDQTIGPNRTFRELAHGLAARGVAVLRYEKRSRARPELFGAEFTVDDETVDDAVAAVALLRADPRIDAARVFVFGHSLGAMMGPRIGARADGLAGLVLAAAPSRPLEDIVPQQVAYLADLDGERSDAELHALADIARGAAAVHALRDGDGDGQPLLLGLPATYWRDLADYDPVATAATLSMPILILQGGRDYQVTLDDFARWQALASRPGVQLQLYPQLNHLLVAGEGPSSPTEYF